MMSEEPDVSNSEICSTDVLGYFDATQRIWLESVWAIPIRGLRTHVVRLSRYIGLVRNGPETKQHEADDHERQDSR
jgi:hypothetical protein